MHFIYPTKAYIQLKLEQYREGPDHLVHQMLTAPITISPEKSLLWDPNLQVGIPQQAFFSSLFSGLIVISTVNIIGIVSDLVPIYTVVEHWLLANDHDCIAVGFSLSLHPCGKFRTFRFPTKRVVLSLERKFTTIISVYMICMCGYIFTCS